MISLQNVTKEYRLDETTTVIPICNVNLEIQRGEFLIIMGRSGSGKTTLLNLCAGLIKPTSGQVLFDGRDIQKLGDGELSALRRRKMGFIFQFQSMLPHLTVIENVAVPAASSITGKEQFQRAAELLEMVALSKRMNVYPKQLSAGELRRVAIARALMNHPEILLADEPTADLDENTELNIINLLRRIHESGVTVAMITHNLDLVPYATRALKVESGRLITVNREEYKDRHFNVGSERPEPVQPFEPAQQLPVAGGKGMPEPQVLTVRTNRPGIHPLTFSLALFGVILGIVALSLSLLRTTSNPQVQSLATQPATPTQNGQLSTGPNNFASASTVLNDLATLQQYKNLAVDLSALLSFEIPGTTLDFPAEFNLPAVPIVWTDKSFSGQLAEDSPGANIINEIDGLVSDKGDTLLSLVFSRRMVQGTISNRTLYRVTLQNLPLQSVIDGAKAGTGTIEKSGASVQNNIVNIEYMDGLLSGSQTGFTTTVKSAEGKSPILKITFGKSGTGTGSPSSTNQSAMK